MSTQEAVLEVIQRFPFQGYFTMDTAGGHFTVAEAARRYVKPGGRILDFGCGPCDKTAVLQILGFQCSGYDDLQDHWHCLSGNRENILNFAKTLGIDFKLASQNSFPFEKASFDLIVLSDVIEHLHNSPKELLTGLLELAKPEGLLLITVPNAVNIRKRLSVMFGETNLPSFDSYFWYPGAWRGHVREYVKNDLSQLCTFLNLDILELTGCDHMIQKIPRPARPMYRMVTALFQGWKDSWLLVAKKRAQWSPESILPPKNVTFVEPACT